MKSVILTIVLTVFCVSLNAQINSSEKQVLLDFYASTNGDSWTQSWDLNQPESEWHGITIEDNSVVGISMLFNNIEGEIPTSIGQLNNLEVLELSFNKLYGTLPTELGNLQNLKLLAFNGNGLNGSIPSSIGNLSNLTQLHLSSNYFSGELPDSIANLKQLEVLNVFDNNLSGKLPSKITNLRNLQELMVAQNDFEPSNEFSSIVLSKGASVEIEPNQIKQEDKHIIAIESEEEN